MSLLKIYQGERLQKTLDEIVAPVQATYHAVDEPEADILTALADVQALTPHLTYTVEESFDFMDRLVVQSADGRELLFIGAPVGMELPSLISAIVIAGRGDSGLLPQTRQALAAVKEAVHIEVFTTPA